MTRQLPPALDYVTEILRREGPKSLAELTCALRDENYRPSERVLRKRLTEWPDVFTVDGDTVRLTPKLARRTRTDNTDDLDPDDQEPRPWWTELPPHDPIELSDIVVLDLETTGLDPATDQIWQIGAVNAGTLEEFLIEVEVDTKPDSAYAGEQQPVALRDALTELHDFIGAATALAGYRLPHFDAPFLQHARQRAGLELRIPSILLDVHRLSVVMAPELSSRALVDVAAELGIPHHRPHHALDDAKATAAVMQHLLARYDPSDRQWALVQRCLHRANDPWARLLTPGPLPEELHRALRPRPDPLAIGRLAPPQAPPEIRSAGGRAAQHADTAHQQSTRSLTDTVRDGFAALSSQPGYRERPGQRQMADRVANALADGDLVAIEAPTGTGKTLAYLLPAIGAASERPVVIATHTKVLQRQLRADAERLDELGVLDVPFRQVFGVANYLCTREIADAITAADATPDGWFALATAVRGLASVPSGTWDDIGDTLMVRESRDYHLQRDVLRINSDACDRRQCRYVECCPLFIRLQGLDSQPGIIATNHYLVGEWIASARNRRASTKRSTQESPSGDADDNLIDFTAETTPRSSKNRARRTQLPSDLFLQTPPCLIFDEAHNLEDALTHAWTNETGQRQLDALIEKLFARYGPITRARRARKALGLELPEDVVKLDHLNRADVTNTLEQLHRAVDDYLHDFGGKTQNTPLLPGVVRNRKLYHRICAEAADTERVLDEIRGLLYDTANQLQQALHGREYELDDEVVARTRQAIRRCIATANELRDHAMNLSQLRKLEEPNRYLHLLNRSETANDKELHPWTYQRIPIEIADDFREDVATKFHSVVLTSATLTVDGTFRFIASRLGLELADDQAPILTPTLETLKVASPFDVNKQAAVVLTSHLPVPLPTTEAEFCEEVARDQIGFLSLSGGKAMTLFASRARMEHVAALVKEKAPQLAERGVTLLVQYEHTPTEIRRQFLANKGASLYGLRSYWEGFDAPGDTLSYLFIEKPPYPAPNDPITAARQRALAERGEDPFLNYVVPKTAILLAQGFGRLIRTETDRGAAIVYDRRIQLPTTANLMLLNALETTNRHVAVDRDDAWRYALEFVTGTPPDLDDALILERSELEQLLDELRLQEGEDPVDKLQRAATELFGIETLRPQQLELMRAILAGRDAIGVLPTGFGKSICYQLPALLHPRQLPTIVISPLVALIKDQVDQLRSVRRLRGVAGITQRTARNERTEILRELRSGKLRLLYLSPERLVRDPALEQALAKVELGALVIDEAHCISSWGHDFRPEFRQITKAIDHLQRSPRLALTATATPAITEDIIDSLKMREPTTVQLPTDRPELRYRVLHFDSERERIRELLRFVAAAGDKAGIVYASRRTLTEQVAWTLNQVGVGARAYHAGMPPEQREAIQDDFLSGNTQVVVATKAFGMGINKPDIEWIVHFDLPESLEAYSQESGRAARGRGLTADAALFYTNGDLARRRQLLRCATQQRRAETAQEILDEIGRSPRRGDHRLINPDELAPRLGIDPDEINSYIAWLERTGHLTRHRDATDRAVLSIGLREPSDTEERRRFFQLCKGKLKIRVGVERRIDFATVADDFGEDPDELEALFTEWTLEGIVSFHPTRRVWRIELHRSVLDDAQFRAAVRAWEDFEANRFDTIARYVDTRRCRRLLIAEAFGDTPRTCDEQPDAQRCDVCAGSPPAWHTVKFDTVPDPDHLVDVELEVLKAVRWAQQSRGTYGEKTLQRALLGTDDPEYTKVGRGILACPQYGALRFVRGNQRRLNDAIETLLSNGELRRETVTWDHRSYTTLVITDAGLRRLGHRRSG
ncbi:MAG: RecQ family ATP-dependent DNA helicase [Acidimicrobiales bacterium]|nr:RecQ family ATP-dependent DNA helicase [Acidimicrobiales bacterium]